MMKLLHRRIIRLIRVFREMLMGVPVFSKNLEDQQLKKKTILKVHDDK